MAFWTKTATPSNGPFPNPICAHTSAEIDKNLYIFGGWTGSKMINDLIVLHTPTMRWNKPPTGGTCGQPRAGQSMTAVGHKLFVFGGANDGVFFNDLQIFDTDTMTWVQAYVTGTHPGARSRHTANVLPAGMLLPVSPSPTNSPANSRGASPATTPRRNSFNEGLAKRNSLDKRSANSLVSSILVFGGGDDRRLYNDLYALNTESLQWVRLEAKGTPPTARWGHTATLIDKKLYVFGGHDGTNRLNDLHVLNIDSFDNLEWQQVQLSSDSTIPPARAGHTADAVGRKIFIYGGGDGKVLSDLYYLDVDTLSISRMNGTSPGRCAHSSTAIDGKLYIFGGGNGTKCFKDMYIFDADSYIKAEEAKMSRLKNKLKVMQKLESFIEQKAKTVQQRQLEKEEDDAFAPTYERITEWLRNLGLERYTQHFIKEEIDMDVAPLLTEKHLIKLGVDSLSARLLLCSAIDKLKKTTKSNATSRLEEQLRDVSKTLHVSATTLNSATVALASNLAR